MPEVKRVAARTRFGAAANEPRPEDPTPGERRAERQHGKRDEHDRRQLMPGVIAVTVVVVPMPVIVRRMRAMRVGMRLVHPATRAARVRRRRS